MLSYKLSMQGTLTNSFNKKFQFKHSVSSKQNYRLLQENIRPRDYDWTKWVCFSQKLVLTRGADSFAFFQQQTRN